MLACDPSSNFQKIKSRLSQCQLQIQQKNENIKITLLGSGMVFGDDDILA